MTRRFAIDALHGAFEHPRAMQPPSHEPLARDRLGLFRVRSGTIERVSVLLER